MLSDPLHRELEKAVDLVDALMQKATTKVFVSPGGSLSLWPTREQILSLEQEILKCAQRLFTYFKLKHSLSDADTRELVLEHAQKRWCDCIPPPTNQKLYAFLADKLPSALENMPTAEPGPQPDSGVKPNPSREFPGWENVKIQVMNEHTVQLRVGASEPQNLTFEAMGFADGRDGTAVKSWKLLLQFASNSGEIQTASPWRFDKQAKQMVAEKSGERAALQSAIAELRKRLKAHFRTEQDPIKRKAQKYVARFSIELGSSLRTEISKPKMHRP